LVISVDNQAFAKNLVKTDFALLFKTTKQEDPEEVPALLLGLRIEE